jgi:predicted membrane-bound mannosyltransferase
LFYATGLLNIVGAALWLGQITDQGSEISDAGWAVWAHLAVSILLSLVAIAFFVKAKQAPEDPQTTGIVLVQYPAGQYPQAQYPQGRYPQQQGGYRNQGYSEPMKQAV